MPITAIVGMQWGDEGKAKILDFLAEEADFIVRYQGGANAGHTVVINDDRFAFHLVPSGMIREGKKCVVGNGVVIDPEELLSELQGLEARGVQTEKRLFLSSRAHVVLPYHKMVEKAQEDGRANKIGTTLRGIGPCYVEKARRSGIRIGDLLDSDALVEKVRSAYEYARRFTQDVPPPEDVAAGLGNLGGRLAPYVADTVYLVNEAYREGLNLLFEGAQGTLLDVDLGTYPYVTSSNSSACGASPGSGVSPRLIDRAVGIVKAYTTRVGGGPFPTELEDETGEVIRDRGREFGTTTGRPRRCGWLDAVGLKYAAMVNAIDEFALTKLDVLTGISPLRMARRYVVDGEETERFPARIEDLEKAQPVYEEMEGWEEDICGARSFDDLPDACCRYIQAVEEIVGVRASIISVGYNREDTIKRAGED